MTQIHTVTNNYGPIKVNNKPKYLALMTTSSPMKVEKLHGCVFKTPVYLDRDRMYFIGVNNFLPGWKPAPGFYSVPEKGFITWIRDFVVKEVSIGRPYAEWDDAVGGNVPKMMWCHVLEALEGEAPKIIA
jgi:hypothetical protein